MINTMIMLLISCLMFVKGALLVDQWRRKKKEEMYRDERTPVTNAYIRKKVDGKKTRIERMLLINKLDTPHERKRDTDRRFTATSEISWQSSVTEHSWH
jgi:hypothetical protein